MPCTSASARPDRLKNTQQSAAVPPQYNPLLEATSAKTFELFNSVFLLFRPFQFLPLLRCLSEKAEISQFSEKDLRRYALYVLGYR